MANQIVNFRLAIALLVFGVAGLVVMTTVSATGGGVMLIAFGICAVALSIPVWKHVRDVRRTR